MSLLETYLTENQIEPLRLSVLAGVRYSTVWNAIKGHPITAEHAQKLRVALYRITGIVYTGTFVTLPEGPVNELPTVPMRKFSISR
ncbi:MAG TPA: hypothetical protein VJ761_14685 [Ktedonobacteraceae bacterium]|nr:hypothetical protein [Ktedonobacteraceae bacterium]